MKVLHVDTTDTVGGAARAAFRIFSAISDLGIDSQFVTLEKHSDDWRVWQPGRYARKKKKLCARGERFLLDHIARIQPNKPWSIALSSTPEIVNHINSSNVDVINLHWINGSCISISDIGRIRKPVVWTLHDTWPFTGGCHYFDECDKYQSVCERCPQVMRQSFDVAKYQFKKKEKYYSRLRMSIVSPSKWLAECASKSKLFDGCNVDVIPYPIRLDIYKPINKSFVRDVLNIPEDKQVILFGADNATHDPRKGYDLLRMALQNMRNLVEKPEKVLLLIFGALEPKVSEGLPFAVKYMGRVYDDYTLTLLYNAADAFIAPSREDNLPNTIMEAMACGTPCVGFRIGGIPDEIEHMVTGYLAEPFDTSDLAKGIETVLENHEKMGMAARDKAAREYNMQKVGQQYLDLYENILSGSKTMN